MANIFNVAEYILEKMPGITTMKLQKLCYYCQAWNLAWDGVPLFEEHFLAYANGPVCFELYDKHRGKFKVFKQDIQGLSDKINPLTKEEKENIDIVLNDYGEQTSQWLSELTHKERPWKETRGNLPLGAYSNKIIPKELIQDYYAGLLADE